MELTRRDPVDCSGRKCATEEVPASLPAVDGVPDLEILISKESHPSGGWQLVYTLTAADPRLRLNHKRFSSRPINAEPESYVLDVFRDIEDLPLKTKHQKADAADRLIATGRLFARLIPDELERELWFLRDRVDTIQIQSQEPHIPWEMLRLHGSAPASQPGEMFLCEAFSVARWLQEVPQAGRLSCSSLALIVPQDSGLSSAPVEGRQILRLQRSGFAVVPIEARRHKVLEKLASGEHDAIHFTGHGLTQGGNPNSWKILLENREGLSPDDLYGRAQGLGSTSPLVFLNACHTGKARFRLTGLGGWSSAFLDAGAGAFLGCHWAVPDDKARAFAVGLYRRLLAGLPIAQAVRDTRLELREKHPGDPTWLAYTLFAHPLATAARRARPAPAEEAEGEASPHTSDSPTTGSGSGAQEPRTRGTADPVGPALPAKASPAPPVVQISDPPLAEFPPQEPPPLPPTPLPGEERRNEVDGTILLYVPGGELTVGAEDVSEWARPARIVLLSPFWIARSPVTNAQYARFLKAHSDPSRPAFWDDSRFNAPEQPVVGVSWEEACEYCRWAGLELPSEAQWEAAARGDDGRRYTWGDEPPSPRLANFGNKVGATSPVGAYPEGAGPFGTLEQAGNVWEWCLDPWQSTAYRERGNRERDPVAQGDPAMRAVRGGAWINPGNDLQAAFRERGTAKLRLNTQGFRCVWIPR